jgi:hypothetical protein
MAPAPGAVRVVGRIVRRVSTSRAPRLRQVAVVTRTPAPVEALLKASIDVEPGYRYPDVDEWGLGTAFCPVGNEVFEVVFAAVRGTVADRFIDRRGGDTGFIVMIEVADLPSYRTRVDAAQVRVAHAGDDPEEGRYIELHPKDTGGTFLELNEPYGPRAGEPDGPWRYTRHFQPDAHQSALVSGIVGAEIACADVHDVAGRWASILGVPTVEDGADAVIELRGGALRFTPVEDARGPGLTAATLRAHDPAPVMADAEARGLLTDDALVVGGLRVDLVG